MMLQQNKLPDINSFLPDHSDFIFALSLIGSSDYFPSFGWMVDCDVEVSAVAVAVQSLHDHGSPVIQIERRVGSFSFRNEVVVGEISVLEIPALEMIF